MNIQKLRGLMTEQNMSQRALAAKLDISLSTFHRKLKSGGKQFTLEELMKMKRILGLTNREASNIFFENKLSGNEKSLG